MQLNWDMEDTSSGLRANRSAEIYSTFLQMGFLFPSRICQCTFVYSDFEGLLWWNLGVKQQPVHAGNSLLCTETGTDGKEGGHIASSPEILAPGEPTVPFGLYQRRCPHWCHPRISSFSFPNASQSPLLLSASSIPSAFKLQSLKAKVNDLLVWN